MSNKVLPKTQYEILKGAPKAEYNKANDVSRRDDTLKELSIGLLDLDQAIKYYFDQVIKPTVVEGTTTIPVPVFYGSPEKWKNFQVDGYYRDKDGKIQAPMIAYKRTAIAKNRTLSSKVDANFPAIYYTQQYAHTPENRYDQFSKLTNSKPIKTFSNTVMCDYVDLTYEFIIWTDYVEQMNKIVESILYSEGSYWGEKERFKFRTKIDSFTNTTDLLADNERIVRTSFTVTMFGYIVPDAIIKQLSEKLSDKTYSPRQVNVLTDVDAKPEIFNKGVAPSTAAAVAMGSTYNVTNTSITQGLDPLIQTYLNTNKAVESTNVTVPDTVTFAANFLTAPSGLPSTSKTSFTFFINSLFVEPSAVTSFTNPTNGVCTLTLDTGILGYTLISGDLIVAVGKFE
jgi:hypothetical protein